MAQEKGKSGIAKPALVFFILLALGATVAFLYYYFLYTGAITALTEQNTRLAAAESEGAALKAKVAALNSDLTALKANVSSQKSQLDLTLEQIKTANAYIDTLRAQTDQVQAETAALRKEKETLLSIIRLEESAVKATAVTVHQKAGTTSEVVSFNVDYAGYVVVSGTSSAPTGYLIITNDNPNFPFNSNKYYFANGRSFNVPVLPGTVGVFFGNSEKYDEFNATVSVTYYY